MLLTSSPGLIELPESTAVVMATDKLAIDKNIDQLRLDSELVSRCVHSPYTCKPLTAIFFFFEVLNILAMSYIKLLSGCCEMRL